MCVCSENHCSTPVMIESVMGLLKWCFCRKSHRERMKLVLAVSAEGEVQQKMCFQFSILVVLQHLQRRS